MAIKKPVAGQTEPKILWEQEVTPVTIKDFTMETGDVEKILWFGESNTGKTRSYLDILGYLKSQKLPAEKVCMCIVFSDRATGITKLYNLIPKEYKERVFIFPVNDYEGLVKATANSEKILLEHFEKTKTHGWLIIELLEEAWRMSQDYYSREAFGETLADLMAAKRKAITEIKGVKDEKKKESAYQALEGWRDWTVIKFFHNFNWIDRIKKMPFNVGATSEVREIDNEDSIFYSIKLRPAGEKDNAHRFDTILYKIHQGDKFYQRCFKLTGYNRLYSNVDITDKNSYMVHKQILQKFEKAGYKSSAIEELEAEAGIPSPPKKEEPKPKPPEEKPKIEVPSISPAPKEEPKKEEPKPKESEKPKEEPKKEEPPKEEKKEPEKPKEEKKEEPKKDSGEVTDWSI